MCSLERGNSRASCYDILIKTLAKTLYSSVESQIIRSVREQIRRLAYASAAAEAAIATQQMLMTMVRVVHCNCRALTWLR